MASSQVEIASSSSPFGHVLRDRNRRCSSHRDSNAFHKNLKDLVDTHVHSHISSSHPPTSSSNHQGDFVDLWVHKPQWDNNENNPTTTIIKKSSHKWDRAREMMLSRSKHRETPQTDDVEVPNLGGVSTLVRRWRDFETVSKINVNNSTTTTSCSTRSNDENAATIEAPIVPQTQRSYEDTCDNESSRFGTSSMSISGDSSDHGEQDKTELPSAPQDSNEREKLRVADIIRKLASSKGEENHESEHGNSTTSVVCGESLPRIKTSFDHSEQQQQQQRIFFPVLHSPRIIRGRQALSDLFLQMERDRHRELEALKQRTAVSKFQQRGRIQALLKVRFLRRGTDARADRSTNGTLSESNRKSQSAIMHIRERFNTQSQNGVADSRSISREATTNNQESRNSTLNQQGVQNCDRENKVKLGSELPSYSKQREENQQGEIIKEGAGIQSVVGCSRSTYRAVEDGGESGFVSTSTQENHPQEPSDPITLRKKMLDNISQVGKSNQLEEKNHNGEVNKKISPKKVTTNVKVTTLSNLQKETTFHTQRSDSSCSPNHNKVDGSHPGVKPSLQYRTSQIQSSNISHDQAKLGNTNCEASHEKLLEIVDTPELPKESKESVHREEQGENNQQCTGTSNERSSESTKPQSGWEEEATNQNLVDSDCGWVSDYSHTPSGWDELQSDYQQQSESNQDWVSDIARPRKEWEGLRQARYQEMLDPFIDNHDIRQLLHRKSVSIFLNSGLREKIDRLMASRSQQIPNAMSDQVVGARTTKEDAKEKEVVFDITKHQTVPHNETQRGDGEDDEEREDSGYEDDFEDENTPILQQYLETMELVDQNKASQDLGSWSNNQERGVRNDSYHFPSNSLLQSQSPDFYSHHNQQCTSFTRHPSAEMELIYDLRGHMEQLHQEIFEIRRSIQSCMNMQMKLQHSIKKEVAAAITQSGPMMGSTSDKKGANCCVCYEGQVDSLLYRCGHICTCFRCAHELLWGTGKCPICQSPIIDVVRAYINNT